MKGETAVRGETRTPAEGGLSSLISLKQLYFKDVLDYEMFKQYL